MGEQQCVGDRQGRKIPQGQITLNAEEHVGSSRTKWPIQDAYCRNLAQSSCEKPRTTL